MEHFDSRAEIERLRDRVYELEQQVAALQSVAGVEGERLTLHDHVLQALQQEGYTPALLAYRRRTSAGLAEAKVYVDNLRREIAGDDAVPDDHFML